MTALVYRKLLSKYSDLKSNSQELGLKVSKENIAALLCVNEAKNYKLTPTRIGQGRQSI